MTIVPERMFPYLMSLTGENNDVSKEDTNNNTSWTYFDFLATMVVVRKNAYIANWTGRKAKVQPYSPNHKPQEILLVDAAILYECPYISKRVGLIVRDSLYVKEMENNLILPFIIREAGVTVKKNPTYICMVHQSTIMQ